MSTGAEQAVPGVVLVVDDNAASRYVASSWLRRHDYRVLEAETGAEALGGAGRRAGGHRRPRRRAARHERLRRVRADQGRPAMGQPVIHLSATAVRAADRVSGLSRGADAYLTEPVEPGELMATIDAVLRYYRARAKAEELAGRLTQLGRIVHDLHAATSFDQLAGSLAAGTAALFGCSRDGAGPRARRGRPAGGRRRRAGRRWWTPLRRRLARALQGSAREADGRPATAATAAEDWAAWEAVLVSGRPGQPALCRRDRRASADGTEQTTLLVQLGQAADAGRRRAAPLHRGAQPRAHATTQLPARADTEASPGWRSPPATCPPPRRPRSAATSTT